MNLGESEVISEEGVEDLEQDEGETNKMVQYTSQKKTSSMMFQNKGAANAPEDGFEMLNPSNNAGPKELFGVPQDKYALP